MKVNKLLIIGISAGLLFACKKDGCTDPAAINYDSKANNDDGSCYYDGQGSGGGGPSNLPIDLTGTQNSDLIIKDQSTNPNVIDYYIDGTWKIDAAVIIEPGVRIEMRSGAAIEISSGGSLNATGLASNKIEIFGKQAQKDFWSYIIYRSSNNPNNKLIHCNISDGGTGSWGSGMITIRGNSQVTIQHSNIKNAKEHGLEVQKGTSIPAFKYNSFDHCGKEPLSVGSLYALNDVENNIDFGQNNGNNGSKNRIAIGNGSYSSSLTLDNMGVPYYFTQYIKIEGGVTTVNPGVTFLMAPSSGINIQSSGALNFDGLASDKITIKGEQAAKGWWSYILFETNHPDNNFSHVNISDGGSGSWGSGMITVRSSGLLSMNDTHISNGSDEALDVKSNSTFTDNGNNTWADCTNGGGELP